MELERQFLFLFSSLGAINGFALCLYLVFFTKSKRWSNYFAGGLLFMLSFRIIKSVFLHFTTDLFEAFIQMGLSACFLIGPFLYLFVKSTTEENDGKKLKKRWWWHILPYILVISITAYFYPYYDNRGLWTPYFIQFIYLQWLCYIILSAILLREHFAKLLDKSVKLNEQEIWTLNVFGGTSIIWLAYFTSSYTSYIVGALSFSVIFYFSGLLWFYRKRGKKSIFDVSIKYENKDIDDKIAIKLIEELNQIMQESKLYTQSNLKIKNLADALKIPSHQLSQILNEKCGKTYNQYVNEYRIEAAKDLLLEDSLLSIEGIGYDCGFNSKSTFFTAFKKNTGTTPSKYRAMHT